MLDGIAAAIIAAGKTEEKTTRDCFIRLMIKLNFPPDQAEKMADYALLDYKDYDDALAWFPHDYGYYPAPCRKARRTFGRHRPPGPNYLRW